MSGLLSTDGEIDDFFYEEDKISKSQYEDKNIAKKQQFLIQLDDEILPTRNTATTTTTTTIKTPTTTTTQKTTSYRQVQHVQQQQQQKQQQQQQQQESSDKQIYNNDDDDEWKEIEILQYDGGIPEIVNIERQRFELERLGMTTSTRSIVIMKDEGNLIGISIGGGAPLCPCLYIVQVFDGTPAALDGNLESGDELLAVNSASVKGKTKVEVAKMIQSATEKVTIHYNKLHADPQQGKTLDFIFKKFKHRIVDSMSSGTADTLGLSRAILCNDTLVKRLEELEGTELMYKGLVEHAKRMCKAYFDLLVVQRKFGDCFAEIGAREPQQRASEVFRSFGEFHRSMEKDGVTIIRDIKPVLDDLGTYLNKAIPDTKLTVKRYADAKFSYLSYCLKVKEMDDEEHGYAAMQEPLYRVETGNYEYRLVLRCRQDARTKFAKLRTDVLEKMELLECKHATDLNRQLKALIDKLAELNNKGIERIETLPPLFPIEVDFKETDFQYKSSVLKPQELDDDELEMNSRTNYRDIKPSKGHGQEVSCGLEAVEVPAAIINIQTEPHNDSLKSPKSNVDLLAGLDLPYSSSGSLLERNTNASSAADHVASIKEDDLVNSDLLNELGLLGIDLSSNPITKTTTTTMTTTESSTNQTKENCNFDLFLNQTSAQVSAAREDLMSYNANQTDLLLQ